MDLLHYWPNVAALAKTGFQLKEIYSITGKKKFTIGEPRAILLRRKYLHKCYNGERISGYKGKINLMEEKKIIGQSARHVKR